MRAGHPSCFTGLLQSGVKISPDIYLASCKRRFGAANPELIRNPVWEWMVRNQHSPYSARTSLGLEPDYGACSLERNPDWCFTRMGMPVVNMDDGREIFIAGEHEDFYDPDFCIYNDAIVRQGDNIKIFAYPRDVFPPTDFHTATLVGDTIWIIGSLGYAEERGGPDTPIFALDTVTYRIRPIAYPGGSPGWLHKHRAGLLPDGETIEINGGEVLSQVDGDERWRRNRDTFLFNTRTSKWQRTTDHSDWREFRIGFHEEVGNYGRSFGWYTGETLQTLGYPLQVASDEEREERTHTLLVQGVRVRLRDDYDALRILIEGVLPLDVANELVAKLKSLLEASNREVEDIQEL